MLLLGSCVGLLPENFFLVTVWSSEALAVGASASTPDEVRTAWRGRGDGYDPKALAERSRGNAFGGALVRRSVSRPRRAWAWRGMIRCRACLEAKRRVRSSRAGAVPCRACAVRVGSGGLGAGPSAGVRRPCGGFLSAFQVVEVFHSDDFDAVRSPGLGEVCGGEDDALDALLPRVFDEGRQIHILVEWRNGPVRICTSPRMTVLSKSGMPIVPSAAIMQTAAERAHRPGRSAGWSARSSTVVLHSGHAYPTVSHAVWTRWRM